MLPAQVGWPAAGAICDSLESDPKGRATASRPAARLDATDTRRGTLYAVHPRWVLVAAASVGLVACAQRTDATVVDRGDGTITFRLEDSSEYVVDVRESSDLGALQVGDCVRLHLAGESGSVISAERAEC